MLKKKIFFSNLKTLFSAANENLMSCVSSCIVFLYCRHENVLQKWGIVTDNTYRLGKKERSTACMGERQEIFCTKSLRGWLRFGGFFFG